jgi:hypothetical protein
MLDNEARNQDHDITRSEAELEKIRLEIERLRIEIPNIRRSRSIDSVVRLTPLITVIIAVLGFTFSVYQYRAEQRINREAQQAQLTKETMERAERDKREGVQAQREFMKPLLERQHELYFEASSAAATIASSKDPEERRKAENTFWKLYWGPLVFVESTDVSGAMKEFGNCLSGVEACTDDELKKRSLSIASTMETSILKTWNLKPEEFTQNQFIYR